MSDENEKGDSNNDDFKKLLDDNKYDIPKAGDLVKGKVISASKA